MGTELLESVPCENSKQSLTSATVLVGWSQAFWWAELPVVDQPAKLVNFVAWDPNVRVLPVEWVANDRQLTALDETMYSVAVNTENESCVFDREAITIHSVSSVPKYRDAVNN